VEREHHTARQQERKRECAKGESERRRAHTRERGSEKNGEREGVALRTPEGPLLGDSRGPNCRMIFRIKSSMGPMKDLFINRPEPPSKGPSRGSQCASETETKTETETETEKETEMEAETEDADQTLTKQASTAVKDNMYQRQHVPKTTCSETQHVPARAPGQEAAWE